MEFYECQSHYSEFEEYNLEMAKYYSQKNNCKNSPLLEILSLILPSCQNKKITTKKDSPRIQT